MEKVKMLFSIVDKLVNDEEIPAENKPHPLKGEWKDFMECHIGDDYLLIWYDKEQDTIKLIRLGSHSELFGKGRKR